MSLLTVITDAKYGVAIKCGLPIPSTIVGSSGPNAPILLAFANEEGADLAERHDWQVLKVAYTVASLGAELQTALPSDFDRMMPNGRIWNRSTNQVYSGPTDDNSMEEIAGLGLTSGFPGWWEILGGSLYIRPAPTAGQTLAFRYISKNWVDPVSGSNKAAYTIDTDVALIPERLISLGIIWRWKSSKGLDYGEAMSTYERALERATARDRGNRVIRPGRPRGEPWTDANWSWPGTIT